jgi:RNA polymerase sigma-70 factor, ECF subfamily
VALRLEEVAEADERAIRRFQSGDQAAFDELYERHRERLYRFCRYRLGNVAEAEDVVQETFARAWGKLPAFGGDGRFYAWLRVIAGNLCTDLQRRSGRTEVRAEVDPGSASEGHEELYRDVDVQLVRSAVVRLKQRHREALELREWDELSYEEIASRVGVSIGTVESLLWRARQALKRELAAISGPEGLLGGVPVVGWLLHRARAVRARLRIRSSRATPLTGGAFTALGAVVVAGVVGAVVVGGQHLSPASTGAPTLPSTTLSVDHPAAPSTTVAPGAAASGGGGVSPATTVPAGHTRTALNGMVSFGGAAARREAQQDPVYASIGPAYLGVDPTSTATYVGSQVGAAGGAAAASAGSVVGGLHLPLPSSTGAPASTSSHPGVSP